MDASALAPEHIGRLIFIGPSGSHAFSRDTSLGFDGRFFRVSKVFSIGRHIDTVPPHRELRGEHFINRALATV
jgi:hypothetical protein